MVWSNEVKIQLELQDRGISRPEGIIINRIRTGHCSLNGTPFNMGKHLAGLCDRCNAIETIERVLISCRK